MENSGPTESRRRDHDIQIMGTTWDVRQRAMNNNLPLHIPTFFRKESGLGCFFQNDRVKRAIRDRWIREIIFSGTQSKTGQR